VDDPADPDSGARALAGFCRPYVRAAQGQLVSQSFNGSDRFDCVIDVDEALAAPTEIYVPAFLHVTAIMSDGAPCTWTQRDGVVPLNLKSGRRLVQLTLADQRPLLGTAAELPA
jgi:hypothetical protein